MKKIFVFVLLMVGSAIAQTDSTSYFEIKLYNTANKLVTGKDVDLYQGVTKKYDLTESSSVPGVYSHSTVRHGEYDIYVNTSLWKAGIWIGSNKVSHVVNLFRFTAGPDTMQIIGHIKATSFEGDGSKLTGISGSVSSAIGDLTLGADSDANGSGSVNLQTANVTRFKINNNGSLYSPADLMILGDANSGAEAGTHTPGTLFQVQSDTNSWLGLTRIYGGGTGARFGELVANDFTNAINLSSTKAGTVDGDNAAWPIVLSVQGAAAYLKIASGGIGVKMASPVSHFHIGQGSTYTNAAGFKLTTDNTDSSSADGFGIFFDSSDNIYVENKENGYMRFDVNGGEAMQISAARNVGIGITPTQKLHVNGNVLRWDYLDLAGAAWFGTTTDTANGIIPCVSFRHTGEDSAWYDLGVFPHAVTIDSAHIEITTTLTSGDSARFVLGNRQVDFGSVYYGAFTTQSSSYVDLGGTANARSKVSCTTAISLTAGRRLILRVHRDNSISNNAAGKVKLVGVILYGKGLR